MVRLRFLLIIFVFFLPAFAQYDQPYRPQVHFSPLHHWTNDPNGLVFYRGEYHLFFQYNPLGDQWGHMSWGHAVSTDLLHWKELPVAISEDKGIMIFTGSVVVDRTNSSGFCKPSSDCLVAIYTGHQDHVAGGGKRQAQYVAYSNDRGRTWKSYEKNPVIDLQMADFRDPSVFWDDERNQWLMAVSLPTLHKVRFYSSHDLKSWTLLSDFGPLGDTDGDWECPDLLQIPMEHGKSSIWALKVGLNPGAPQGGSGEQYFLGRFDGKQFSASTEVGAHGWTNYGKDDYCAISFNNLPKKSKPVLIGWMSNWQYAASLPTSPWRGQMSIPRTLSYLRDQAGVALKQEPLMEPLRAGQPSQLTSEEVEAPFELALTFEAPDQKKFGVRIFSDHEHWTEIAFDRERKQFYIDRTRSSIPVAKEFPAKTVAPLVDGRPFDLRLIVDRSSLEAFAQEGTIAMTNLQYPPSVKLRIEVFGAKPNSALQWKLHSLWKK
jgi:fructan beta-fructosidase